MEIFKHHGGPPGIWARRNWDFSTDGGFSNVLKHFDFKPLATVGAGPKQAGGGTGAGECGRGGVG